MNRIQAGSMFTRIPVYRELEINSFDFMSLLMAMDSRGCCIFLESAAKTKMFGRYSYLCFNPVETVTAYNSGISVKTGNDEVFHRDMDIFKYIDSSLSRFTSPSGKEYGDFNGGYTGYILYDSAGYGIGRVTDPDDLSCPVAELILVDEFIVFDNISGKYHLCTAVYPDSGAEKIDDALRKGAERLDRLGKDILDIISDLKVHFLPSKPLEKYIRSSSAHNPDPDDIKPVIEKIIAGELPSAAVSKTLTAHGDFSPYSFYIKLRGLSPAPYLYYMNLPSLRMAGSTTETHLKISSGLMMMKPSSGHCYAPQARQHKASARRDLLRSHEDKITHQSLVDTSRDDLCGSAVDGSLSVKKFMEIGECHGMISLVSRINALIDPEKGMARALKGTFHPERVFDLTGAGRSSGTCKGRQYAGVAGYFGFNRSCDTCSTSGSAVFRGRGVDITGYTAISAVSSPENTVAALERILDPAVKSLGYAGRL